MNPAMNNSRRYSRRNAGQLIRPDWTARRRRSLGARLGIHTSYRLADIPRPRKRAARMRRPSTLRSIGLETDLVRSMVIDELYRATAVVRDPSSTIALISARRIQYRSGTATIQTTPTVSHPTSEPWSDMTSTAFGTAA